MNPSLPFLVFSVIAASFLALPAVAGGFGMDLPRLTFPQPATTTATVSSTQLPKGRLGSVSVSASGN